MIMDNEQPHQELVKCVVVGDTAVGKTRLICARACNKHVSLSQLLTTHVPTVWAIDQYRIYKDVLERSWEVVDGVNVSLRLWDTFGDHEKDRRFAYGRSDVVLLCFSITSITSLKNCLAMWYPEIRRFCPHTPVLLVGCKNDLRYMYRDEVYLSFFKDKSPFLRATRKSDLVMPDQARAVARELGIYYYETSVLTYYGVNEAFENAIRAALLARRHQRFWMTNLKKVQRPLLQAPYLPPKPCPPEIFVGSSSYDDNCMSMLKAQAHTDVIFVCGYFRFSAHRFVLAAGSPTFHRLFLVNFGRNLATHSSSDSSMTSTLGETTQSEFNEDTEYLIRNEIKHSKVWDQLKRRSSCQVLTTANLSKKVSPELNHPAFESICVKQCEGLDHRGRVTISTQTVLTLTKLVTVQGLKQCLQFIYTGGISTRSQTELQEIRQTAEFLDFPELLVFVSNILAREEFQNGELRQRYKQAVRQRLKELCVGQGLFSDVVFQLDDTSFPAHRAILMARCDVMKAMFSGDFRESAAKVILFPGVREDTFLRLLLFIYTDDIPFISPLRCVDILELANRLCLPRLVNLVEERVVEELTRSSLVQENNDTLENCLRLLEPCKLHNADQLADWCLNYLCTNYDKLCKKYPKLLKGLHPDNQDYIREHRWPPVWYLKDYDYYEKCVGEREREEKTLLKRNGKNSGCLCFASNKSKKESEGGPTSFKQQVELTIETIDTNGESV
ncbi:hypothetical protein RUM44_001747 [Polyplax serrata]|uniref:BTB domain-containing protein n=1 Tax=Polyplax serrata TaxID=468196 RepID=A0ABR1AKX8_POLSC